MVWLTLIEEQLRIFSWVPMSKRVCTNMCNGKLHSVTCSSVYVWWQCWLTLDCLFLAASLVHSWWHSCLGAVCERVSFWDSAQPAWAYGYAGHESVALGEKRNWRQFSSICFFWVSVVLLNHCWWCRRATSEACLHCISICFFMHRSLSCKV